MTNENNKDFRLFTAAHEYREQGPAAEHPQTHHVQCHLCGKAFEAVRCFIRFCDPCKQGDDVLHFMDWLESRS
jgi:hypothetical protein